MSIKLVKKDFVIILLIILLGIIAGLYIYELSQNTLLKVANTATKKYKYRKLGLPVSPLCLYDMRQSLDKIDPNNYSSEILGEYILSHSVDAEKMLNQIVPEKYYSNHFDIGQTLEAVTGKKIILLNEFSTLSKYRNLEEFDYSDYKKQSQFWKYSTLNWQMGEIYIEGMNVGDLMLFMLFEDFLVKRHKNWQNFSDEEREEYYKLREHGWYINMTCVVTDKFIIFLALPADIEINTAL